MDAVVQRNHCRTWPTPTASSFRGPTWPSAIPWDTSGWRRLKPAERRSSTWTPGSRGPRRCRISTFPFGPALTWCSSARSSTTSSPMTCGSRSTSLRTPTPPRWSTRITATPRTWAACSPALIRRSALTTRRRGPMRKKGRVPLMSRGPVRNTAPMPRPGPPATLLEAAAHRWSTRKCSATTPSRTRGLSSRS